MKFAFLIFKYFPYGGVQRDMLRIALDLTALGHAVTIYTGEWRGDKPNGLDVVLLPVKGLLNHQRHQYLIKKMQAAVTFNPPDLIVGFNRMAGLDVYYAADPCYLAFAAEQRSWWYRYTSRYRFFAACEHAVMHASGRCKILTLAPREKGLFQQYYQTPEARFYALPPNIPTARFAQITRDAACEQLRASYDLPAQTNIMLMVGSAFMRKGLDRAIVALANLPADILRNTWLIAVGEDKPKKMQALAKKHGLDAHLIMAGPQHDVPKFMLGADVLLHVARSELAGLVLIEAMTAGLPQIVTENCGYAFHVKAARAGIVLDAPFTQAAFNEALTLLLQDKAAQGVKLANMRESALAYTTQIAATTSKSTEADYLVQFAKEALLESINTQA